VRSTALSLTVEYNRGAAHKPLTTMGQNPGAVSWH
jgi:hypothetical protein